MRAIIFFALGMAALAGCSTPRVAMDQANNTVGLVAQLESELKEFRRVQSIVADSAKDSIRQIRLRTETDNSRNAALVRASKAASDPTIPVMYATIVDLSDAVGTEHVTIVDNTSKIDDRLAKLLQPLPATTDKTTLVQSSLAPLGTELSASTRKKELSEFYGVVKRAVDANKAKLKASEMKDQVNASAAAPPL